MQSTTDSNNSNDFNCENLNCFNTIKLASYLTIDSICCVPCCCFCGGCCGKYNACVLGLFPNEAQSIQPGFDRFSSTCHIQMMSWTTMTFTCCGCCWACCGTCTPCAKFIAKQVVKNETSANQNISPQIQEMS